MANREKPFELDKGQFTFPLLVYIRNFKKKLSEVEELLLYLIEKERAAKNLKTDPKEIL